MARTKRIALIPARGGSSGIRLKNLAPVAGRPLVGYVVRNCLMAGVFDEVVVSTDSQAVASVASRLGATVHIRELESPLGEEEWSAEDVSTFFLGQWQTEPEWLYWVQPTSPTVSPTTLSRLVSLESSELSSVQVVSRVPHRFHEFNQRQLLESGEVAFVDASRRGGARLRQEKPERYAFAGAVGVRVRQGAPRVASMFAEPSRALVLDPVVDIDLDIDDARDIRVFESLLASGQVWDAFRD